MINVLHSIGWGTLALVVSFFILSGFMVFLGEPASKENVRVVFLACHIASFVTFLLTL